MNEEEIYEETKDLLKGDDIEKERIFGTNIIFKREKKTFSTKMIYSVLFICLIVSILIYLFIRLFLLKKTL